MTDRPGMWWKPAMRLVFALATAFALIMAVLPHPPQLPGDPNDKLLHAVTFFTLTVLAAMAWPRAGRFWLLFWLSAFGALIEVVQATGLVHRDSSGLDWLADVLAVLLGLAAVGLVRRTLKCTGPK